MEEPTMAERIRDIHAALEIVVADLADLKRDREKYVTRELYDLHRENDRRRIAELEERDKSRVRMLYSAGVLPLLVLVMAYALGVKP